MGRKYMAANVCNNVYSNCGNECIIVFSPVPHGISNRQWSWLICLSVCMVFSLFDCIMCTVTHGNYFEGSDWGIREMGCRKLATECWINSCFPRQQSSWGQHGPTWVLSAPDGPYVGPMHLASRVVRIYSLWCKRSLSDDLPLLAMLEAWCEKMVWGHFHSCEFVKMIFLVFRCSLW